MRYKERWDKLSQHMETVNKDVRDIHITTDKISKRFDEISSVNIEKNKEIEGWINEWWWAKRKSKRTSW